MFVQYVAENMTKCPLTRGARLREVSVSGLSLSLSPLSPQWGIGPPLADCIRLNKHPRLPRDFQAFRVLPFFSG